VLRGLLPALIAVASLSLVAARPALASPGWQPAVTLSNSGFPVMVGVGGPAGFTIAWDSINPNRPVASDHTGGGTFSTPTNLSPGTTPVGDVGMSENDNGNAVMAWSESSSIQAVFRVAHGAWSAPVTMGTASGSQFVSQVKVAIDPQGNTAVAWQRNLGSGTAVVDVRLRDASGALGSVDTFSVSPRTIDRTPDVAFVAPGQVALAWVSLTPIPSDTVLLASQRSLTSAWSTPVQVASNSAQTPALAGNGAGLVVLTWHDITTMWARPLTASGWGASSPLASSSSSLLENSRAAIAGNGEATTMWSRYTGSAWNIEARTFNGATWGATTVVSTAGNGQAYPALGTNASGDLVAAWRAVAGSATNEYAMVKPHGQPWPSSAQLLGDAGNWPGSASIDPNGLALVGWIDTSSPGRVKVAFSDAPSTLSIDTNPFDQVATVGDAASFSASATGNPTPTVAWESAPAGSNVFSPIPGATSSTLTLNGLHRSSNGSKYRAVFTNAGGTATTTAATLTVNPAPLTVVAPSTGITYGDAVPTAWTPTLVGLVNGDTGPDVQPTCVTNAPAGADVGSYTVNCSGASDADYDIAYSAGTLTVGPAALTVTAPSPVIHYGDAVPALPPAYTGLVNGDAAPAPPASCTTTASAGAAVGTYPVTCSNAADGNYVISYAGGTLTVASSSLTISAPSTALTYGDAVPTTFTPVYTGLKNGDQSPAVPPTCTTTAVKGSPVGTYPVTCSGASDPNYDFTYAAGTVTIVAAPVTVTAPSQVVTFGDAIPASFNPALVGLVNGDVALHTVGTCTTTATAGSPVGTYPITCTGFSDPNYTVSYAAGTLTIVRAATSLHTSAVSIVESALTLRVTFRAELHAVNTGAAVVGRPITFRWGYNGNVACTASTDAHGVATCSVSLARFSALTALLLAGSVNGSFAGTTNFLPAADTARIELL
jgi:hypothetical protein